MAKDTPPGALADAVRRARKVLHAAERGGHWQVIEAAHKVLLRLEIEQWLHQKFGGTHGTN